jgi:hypothetical protein
VEEVGVGVVAAGIGSGVGFWVVGGKAEVAIEGEAGVGRDV